MLLREKILESLNRRKSIDQRKLSQIAGVKDAAISRYLNGFEQLNFESILKIVKYLYPVEELSIMGEYVLTQKSKNARYALDYCFMHNLKEQGEELIDRLLHSNNPSDKEWGGMYALLNAINQRERSFRELLQQVEMQKPKECEMQILKGILKAYVYFGMDDFHSIVLHVKDTEKLLEEMKRGYIKDSFYVRLGLMMNYVALFDSNDVEKSRYYSSLIIEQDFFQGAKASAYNQLGHSYLFENYELAKHYMELAIDQFQKNGRDEPIQVVQHNLCFLQSYWRIQRPFPFELKGDSEKVDYAYYLIQSGAKDQAIHLLEEVVVEQISEWNKAFYYYYMGLLHEKKDLFYQSIELFRKKGDFFHIQLPIQELHKLGENELALKMLSTKQY